MRRATLMMLALLTLGLTDGWAQKKKDNDDENLLTSGTFSGLQWREVGPALASGRIGDLAVHPDDRSVYYVAVASGGVWKTENAGTTFTPIFDNEGAYSIGCITMDPNNPNVLWVGTGENNNQRSVAYGDGLYKSLDAGKSWTKVGLENSEHIGMIAVDPRNSDVVYVAAYGPLWSAGGDRGLYKTTDGGDTWEKILDIDQYTGINEVHLDPRDPDVIYATAHQRMRKVWTYLGGGPESAIYKSEDSGESWRKIMKGIPNTDIGRIGMDISPVNPDVLYAIVEAQFGKSGFFKSTDRGESWEKQSDYVTSGNYYQEIFCDPVDVNTVYAMNTFGGKTTDGGKSWDRIGNKYRHVDDHALWVDPNDPDYFLIGCDGGVYESFDGGKNWDYMANLPITQFYKVVTDNAEPFYNIYGGTQDNNSLGGPSRTISSAGITNADWFKTNPGDGFESAVDPNDPNIVYAQSQYGWLFRFDKASGERILIKPQEPKDEAYRWNWDAPLIVSPHSPTRLYFAANKLFRSDNRGDDWEVISPDLTRQLDRNKLEIMGRVWSVDAIAKNRSTTIYGNIVALTESPVQENLLYIGTDDGLIQVTDNAGESWQKFESFPGVPERTYVNMVLASQHDAETVYAVFNNHKNGDFKPYILKSTDKGDSWTSIAGDLPERGSVYAIAEDHENPDLLFAGTEFGIYFTVDGGEHWVELGAGLPTIAIRDIDIQQRENDLVVATFGRSFYVLDDYSPLREVTAEMLEEKEAHIFPIKDSWMFIESNPFGYSGKGFQGSSFYTAPNPPVGATFTYYIKEGLKTPEEERREKEKELIEEGEPVYYPTYEELKAEDDAVDPYLVFVITDEDGNIVRRLKTSAKGTGVQRITWDFRYHSTAPAEIKKSGGGEYYSEPDKGRLAVPGTYHVSLYQVVNDSMQLLVDKTPFTTKLLGLATLPAADREAAKAFTDKVARLRRAVEGAATYHGELEKQLKYLKAAIEAAPQDLSHLLPEVRKLDLQLRDMERQLMGDRTLSSREFEAEPGLGSRVGLIIYGFWKSTSAPTETMDEQYDIVADEFEGVLNELQLITAQVETIEEQLEAAEAPYTPGRLPDWSKE